MASIYQECIPGTRHLRISSLASAAMVRSSRRGTRLAV